MIIEISLLYLTAVANLFLGLIVFARSYRKTYGWFFLLAVIGAVLWGVGDALISTTQNPNFVPTARFMFYVGPMAIPVFMWFFSLTFPERKLNSWASAFGAILFAGSALAIVLWPHGLINRIIIRPNGNLIEVNTTGFAIYACYFSAMFILSYVALMRLYLSQRSVVVRAQVMHVLAGLLLASVPALITNLGLPIIGYSSYIWLGPIFSSAFVVAVTISIIRHRMFDIRSVVARSLGYAFSMMVLAALYGFVVFGVAKIGFHLQLPVSTQIWLAVATGVSGLIFPYLRQRFDKLTNQLFYRDAYDPQQLFSQLNSMLVTSLDTKYLMMQSISIVETALKPEFALVGLRDESGQRIFGSKKINFDPKTIAKVRKMTPRIHHKVIAADYIEEPRLLELRDIMLDNNVSVIVRLTQDVRKTEEGLGYLVLGPRKSGNPYTPQDLRVLDTVANEMIIAIQNSLHYEEIQHFNEALQLKIDEATRKLRRSNEKLKALDETKDDFISMASHQLRTPLTSVKGYLSMVLEGDAGEINETQKKMLGQAFISSQRMVYLIADLLNVSRLRTGKFVIEPVATDLSLIIQEELAQLVETAEAREITLNYSKPKDFPALLVDETKTRQVIMNFVDNAIYYTPAGGHITVELAATAKAIELRVIDDGIGVPKHEQHHLFTKFYRAGNARKARPDGTGLGLYMAKKVILAQGGSIIFDSKEGKGSTFGFSFPLKKGLVIEHQPLTNPEKVT